MVAGAQAPNRPATSRLPGSLAAITQCGTTQRIAFDLTRDGLTTFLFRRLQIHHWRPIPMVLPLEEPSASLPQVPSFTMHSTLQGLGFASARPTFSLRSVPGGSLGSAENPKSYR